jgi:bacterioferritin-associated ferredoxin
MYVCHCEAITDRTIDAAIASGARCVAEVTARCRAGGGCGGVDDSTMATSAA